MQHFLPSSCLHRHMRLTGMHPLLEVVTVCMQIVRGGKGVSCTLNPFVLQSILERGCEPQRGQLKLPVCRVA